MAAISRAQLMNELIPGLNALFGQTYNTYEQEHGELFDEHGSSRSFEEDQKITGFGNAPVKEEGMATAFDTAQEGYTARYVHETISMGFAITQEAVEDNLYDTLSARYTRELARSMASTKQIKAASVLNNGFTTFNTGDGVTLFNTAHPQVSAPPVANRPTTPADLNETSLEAATVQISKWTDDRGKLINARVQKLIIPVDLMFTAKRILETDGRVGTADNDLNAIKKMSVVPQGFAVMHYLTDPDAWFIKTDITDGFKYFNRVPITEDNDGDFDTGNFRYKMRERYSFGVSDALAGWGSPGA